MKWSFCKKGVIFVTLFALVMTAAGSIVSEEIFHNPLFEVGWLWWRAAQSIVSHVTALLQFDFQTWTAYIKLAVLLFGAKWCYGFFIRPLNRVRKLGDIGYVPEGNYSLRETANMVQKRRLAGNCPPVYPNGWFFIYESRDLKVGESQPVSCLGLNLAIFRGEDGRVHVLDAYCPHMGAHLGVGGLVKGNCIECPFHGWKFRGDDGKCVLIPYAEDATVPERGSVKSHTSLERNGFIYLWYHAESKEPDWEPPEIEEITNGSWTYTGRSEHEINCHIEEVPENGADVAHLGHLHGPGMVAGIDLRYTSSKLWSWFRHSWSGTWVQNSSADEKHIGTLSLTHSLHLFGKSFSMLDLAVEAQQIGPGIVYLTYNSSFFGRGAFLQALTPQEPLRQRLVHHCYMQWYIPTIIGKFFMLGEALQVERDVMIWNNKRYESKPAFVKSKEDSLVAKHRRWYSQFYSEHSPRLHFQKDSTDW